MIITAKPIAMPIMAIRTAGRETCFPRPYHDKSDGQENRKASPCPSLWKRERSCFDYVNEWMTSGLILFFPDKPPMLFAEQRAHGLNLPFSIRKQYGLHSFRVGSIETGSRSINTVCPSYSNSDRHQAQNLSESSTGNLATV